VTTDIGESVMITRLDITTGLPKRDLTMPYVLQMASEEILPIVKEVLVKLTGVALTDNFSVHCQYH
jgi:hypothetical protein